MRAARSGSDAGRQPAAAIKTMQAAARPGAGTGESAPMVATMSVHHRASGSPATFQTAQDHEPGMSISGQVVSISHATPCRQRRAERLGRHGQRRSHQHSGHDEQRIERHGEEVDEDRDERDSAKAPDQDRHEPDADGELQTAVIPEHARRPGTTARCEHDCGNRSE